MNYGNLGYNNSIFTGERDIKDGTIYSVGAGRERVKVGVDAEREQELLQSITAMQETLDSWRPKMIEHGYIKIEKSAEETARELAEEQLRIAQEQAEQYRQQAELREREFQKQAQQQAEINQALLKAISGIQTQLGEVNTNGRINGYGVESSIDEIGSDSKENRKVTRGSKTSTSTGKTNSSGKSK